MITSNLSQQRWEVGALRIVFQVPFVMALLIAALWNSSIKICSFVCSCWSWFSKVNNKDQIFLTEFSFLVTCTTLCLSFCFCFCFTLIDHELRHWLAYHYTPPPIIGTQWILNDGWIWLFTWAHGLLFFLLQNMLIFLEPCKKEITYLCATTNINLMKIWLNSKLYVEPRYIYFTMSIFQGVWQLHMPLFQAIALKDKITYNAKNYIRNCSL